MRGIATLEAAHGPEHPDVAAVLSHFAALLHRVVRTYKYFFTLLLCSRNRLLSRDNLPSFFLRVSPVLPVSDGETIKQSQRTCVWVYVHT